MDFITSLCKYKRALKIFQALVEKKKIFEGLGCNGASLQSAAVSKEALEEFGHTAPSAQKDGLLSYRLERVELLTVLKSTGELQRHKELRRQVQRHPRAGSSA